MPIKVKRLSDGAVHELKDIHPTTFVKTAKDQIKKDFAPKFENGCKLKYGGKVLKSRHHFHHYGVTENDTIEMDDTKNWSSSSSDSNSQD